MSHCELGKVVTFINKHKHLNLNPEEVRGITKELVKAGFSESVKKSEVPTIKGTIEHIVKARRSHNPLRATTAEVVQQQSCPLCATTASPVRLVDVVLAGERPAKYCSAHNVTVPIRQAEK